jgi:pimeloyl-ACP methyl ester carboxylesterase
MGKKNKIPLALQLIPKLFPVLEAVAPPLANRFFRHLFFTPLRYGIPEKEKEAAAQLNQFYEVVNGKNLQCYQSGDANKRVVLLIHGWAGRAMQFRRFIDPIKDAGFQVVLFDGPAHGGSAGKQTNLDEFRDAIMHFCSRYDVAGIITHSFGGAATLYSLTQGLAVRTVVNIASPTIGEEIISTYLRAIGGSKKTGENFRAYVQKRTGKPFDSFTALGFIDAVPRDLNLLLIHDADDPDVIVDQARALQKRFPMARLIETQGLGHTRILKDDEVIRQAVTFIRQHSSGV